MKVNIDIIRPPSVTPIGIKTVNRVAYALKWLAKPEFGDFEPRYGDMFLATKVGENVPFAFSFVNENNEVIVHEKHIGEVWRYNVKLTDLSATGGDKYGLAWNTMWLEEQNPSIMIFYLKASGVKKLDYLCLLADAAIYLSANYDFKLTRKDIGAINIYQKWRDIKSGIDTAGALKCVPEPNDYSIHAVIRFCLESLSFYGYGNAYDYCYSIVYDKLRKIMNHDEAKFAIADSMRASLSLEKLFKIVAARSFVDENFYE